jgi:hypothetical protein
MQSLNCEALGFNDRDPIIGAAADPNGDQVARKQPMAARAMNRGQAALVMRVFITVSQRNWMSKNYGK